MNFYQQSLYRDFEKFLSDTISKKSSCVIITIPGLGVSYFIKKFLSRSKLKNINYIFKEKEKVETFNILDLNFDKNEEALNWADEYFENASVEQKFALIINTPWILKSQEYKTSFLSSHIFSSLFFSARDLRDTSIFAKEINQKLDEEQIKNIFDLSGGIGRLIKFFAIRTDLLESKIEDMLKGNSDLLKLMIPTIEAIEQCDDSTLSELKIRKEGMFVSQLFDDYFKEHTRKTGLDISIGPDLTFSENGRENSNKLNRIESRIIEFALSNGGLVQKEKVADFKWGEGSYDKYSDQAITKTIQRLRKKLMFHNIEVVSGVGYKLVIKN